MNFYSIASLILTVAILIAYVNHRYIKMQTTIAIMVSSLLISLLFILLSNYGLYTFEQEIARTLVRIDFGKLLINGMLSFLLFAGSLTIDIHTLRAQKWEIITLASFSTIASTLLIGMATYYSLPFIGIHLDFIYCMLFGALISPTDPIAVLATFKLLKAPKSLETTVAGESLFNDGVGIVLFLSLYQLAVSHEPVTFYIVSKLFLQQAVGGIVYGIVIGYIGSWLIKHSLDEKIKILLTLAIATGGYSLANALDVSGPLAMVVSGIIIGSYARNKYMNQATQNFMDEFWELIDELLNCVLFLLIGFEIIIIAKSNNYMHAGILAIPLVLVIRAVTVMIPMAFFKIWRTYCPYMTTILVWGGLRGGLAVALSLALPQGDSRQIILSMTYAVVAFAIIVQGITIQPLVKLAKGELRRH